MNILGKMAICISTTSAFSPKRVLKTKRNVKVHAMNKEQSVKVPKYLEFAETINGRCAMQGFIWGSVREGLTGNTILEQVMTKTGEGQLDINPEGILSFAAIVALVSLGTAITEFNPKDDSWNGRNA